MSAQVETRTIALAPLEARPPRNLEETAASGWRGFLPEGIAIAPSSPSSPKLKHLLVISDLVAAAAGWSAAFLTVGGYAHRDSALALLLLVPLASLLTIALMAAQRLYFSRVCNTRSVELTRVGRVAAVSSAALVVIARAIGFNPPIKVAVAGGLFAFCSLAVSRSVYAAYLKRSRGRGRYRRPIVIVGTNDEGFDLYRLISLDPELGYSIVGVVGDLRGWFDYGFEAPFLGDYMSSPMLVRESGANGVLVAATSMPSGALNRCVRRFLREGMHVQVSTGLRGIDRRRLLSSPVGYEPLIYVEPGSLSAFQLAAKRILDVVLGSIALILSSPVILLAAAAIMLVDRGPVLFKQERVGRHGAPFTMFKLRTMVPGAEEMQSQMTSMNGRDGPLFKLSRDPRVTPIGRILRAASIDELPQLWNVLQGKMSLVGPRPALKREVDEFDEDLKARDGLRPGVTGLWQVEGRDSPSFFVYRRLDLFYVENWSVGLDLVILASTVLVVISRALRALVGGSSDPSDEAFLCRD